MASKSQAWKRFARDTQGSPATYAKGDISLSKVGQSVPGSWGAGKNTHHVPAPYLSNLFIITGSPYPSSAGTDITAAHACTYFGSVYSMAPPDGGELPPDVEKAPFMADQWLGATVPRYLAKWIEWFAANGPRNEHSINDRRINFDESWFRIDFAPFAAQMSWQLTDRVVLTDYFLSQHEVDARRHLSPEEAARQMSRVRRSALVSASLLLTAAELLADGSSGTDGSSGSDRELPFPEPEEASASASSENEKTPVLPGTGASTRHKIRPRWRAVSNQPHAATRLSNDLDFTEIGTRVQPPFLASVRHPFLDRKDAVYRAEVAQP